MGWYHSPDFAGFDDMKAEADKQEELRTQTTTTATAAAAAAAAVDDDDEDDGNTPGYSACPLPSTSAPPPPPPDVEYIYHLCQGKNWLDAVAKKQPYFPPTFVKDGKFTRATTFKRDLVDTANTFYKDTPGEWICLELKVSMLYAMGIPILSQEAPESTKNKHVTCLQVFGGISTQLPGLISKIYTMSRKRDGTFLAVTEPDCGCSSSKSKKPKEEAKRSSSKKNKATASSPPPEAPKSVDDKEDSKSNKPKKR
eukprot:CAMPEP_0119545536 /NCGR_PEP_ID=MMETSP1352-20130426/256_1 /TAXON_ID=265584 /ORGANISM="Stauroneis constricta, Strain CCMP1120" /LENGTH=253 /DNA_ID=CAMNT_0007590091 /DNA_START=111 /DNA_END=869 /DNA_ORIENTATION=-